MCETVSGIWAEGSVSYQPKRADEIPYIWNPSSGPNAKCQTQGTNPWGYICVFSKSCAASPVWFFSELIQPFACSSEHVLIHRAKRGMDWAWEPSSGFCVPCPLVPHLMFGPGFPSYFMLVKPVSLFGLTHRKSTITK